MLYDKLKRIFSRRRVSGNDQMSSVGGRSKSQVENKLSAPEFVSGEMDNTGDLNIM